MAERVGILGRLGEALTNPTVQEQRQAMALQEEQRLSGLRDETELVNYLQSNQIIDNTGNFISDQAFANLLADRSRSVQVANATNSIGQYKTKSGKVAQGKVVGFVQNDDDESISIVMQRPDGKFAPKTWFSTENDADRVVKLSKGEFKDFMTQNYRAIDSRVKPLRGEAVSNQPNIDELGSLTNEIDNDPNLSMEEKQNAILEITKLISPTVDKSTIEETDLGLPRTEKQLTKQEESKIQGFNVVDTGSPETQASAALISGLNPETILSDSEIKTLSQGLSKGFRNAFINSYKFGQAQLQANQREIDQADEKAKPRLEKIRQRLTQQQQERIDRVSKNIEDDAATRQTARDKVQTETDAKRSTVEQQLANPDLSETKRKELQDELTTMQPKVQVESSLETYNFTELPTSADDNEAFTKWFETNKAELEKASKDGDLINKVKKVITKFDVQSAEDIDKIPFDTPEAENLSRIAMANVMAGNTSVDRMGNVPNYAAQLAGNMQIFDAYGTQARAQASFAQQTITWRNGLNDRADKLANDVITSYSNIVDLLYPMDDNKLLRPNDIRQQAPRIREELLKVEANPTTPKFTPDGKGGYVIQGGTVAGKAAAKDIAGILFERLVQANGPSGVKDWFGDVFTRRGETPDLGQILDRVRYTRNARGEIDEIFYVGAQGQTLDGSIELGGLTDGFGQEGSYARNLLLAFIAEDPRGIKEINK